MRQRTSRRVSLRTRGGILLTFLLGLQALGCQGASPDDWRWRFSISEAFDRARRRAAAERSIAQLPSYPPAGTDDIRDILVLDGTFLVATGKGVSQYRTSGDKTAVVTVYSTSSGLPSSNVLQLRRDAEGGIWALCEGGVGYLPSGQSRWTSYTPGSELASGRPTALSMAPDGRRVWVATSEEIATKTIQDHKWQRFRKKGLLAILVAPEGTKAWCLQVIPFDCMCESHFITTEFDLATRKWVKIPKSQNCPHVAPSPAYFCRDTNRLWFSNVCDPPLLYDPVAKSTRTWPKEPNWERTEGSNCTYWDWFGQMLPVDDGSGRMWFATNAGLWQYDPKADIWELHRFQDNLGAGQALLVRTQDARTIYWECDGIAVAYDIVQATWRRLWETSDASMGFARQELLLSPDQKHLWWTNVVEIAVGNIETGELVRLPEHPFSGEIRPQIVRFDTSSRSALVGTYSCLFRCDYAGNIVERIEQPAILSPK